MKTPNLVKRMKSPFADKDTALLCSESATTEYRGETYSYTSYWYRCQRSGECFTTNESDALCTAQVHEQYRTRHHIPSVEEIAALRRQCRLSAARMSSLLGIGINQYRLYEAGEMPSLSIGKILYALCHNPETLKFYQNHSPIRNTAKKRDKEGYKPTSPTPCKSCQPRRGIPL